MRTPASAFARTASESSVPLSPRPGATPLETWRTSVGGVSQVPAFILLSDEMGNMGWGVPGIPNPPEDAILPDYFYIDYVRVYEYVPPDEQ